MIDNKEINSTPIQHFTRGGQTFLHQFRMINQIVSRVLIFCMIVFLIATLCLGYVLTTPYQRYVIQQLGKAELLLFFQNKNIMQMFTMPDGK